MDTRICFLLFTISPCIALECSSCVHFAFEYINMPDDIEGVLNEQLSTLETLRNEQCFRNTAPTKNCAVAGPGFNDTCTWFTFTMKCMGFTAANLHDTGITVTVVNRQCSPSPKDTVDTCVKKDTLYAKDQFAFLQSVQSLATLFDSVEYNGDYCTSSTGLFPNTPGDTSKRNSASSKMLLMQSVAILLIASYLV
ncbi:uncharacterized protein LOC128244644 [Mya arenaria]|uniref:uncharacterized protein LOC128244644 n=1 Tax=Mya arenaria TaxID=6604 RepID=UPI0022E2556E|nr:uncharacterized protein LOC128244644 [Mya arenaria]